MTRILSIDYGRRRCGIAVTDILQISARGLDTVSTNQIMPFLKDYIGHESVETIIVGEAHRMDCRPSESMKYITPFVKQLEQTFPNIDIILFDERFTSKMAFQAMIDGGVRRKDRGNKGLIDKVSATILLSSYLDSLAYKIRRKI